MNTSKAVIVFSGYNQRAVIALLRTLKKHGITFGIIAASAEDTIHATAYAHDVVAVRKSKPLDMADITASLNIAKAALGADTYVIAPSTEALNRFFLANTEIIDAGTYIIPLVTSELYEKISDKYQFGELCREHEILVPDEYATLPEALTPCVAKPKAYFALDGSTPRPVLLLTPADIQQFKAEYNEQDFYFQEYVEGESLYLLYYFYEDGSVAKYSQQNLVQQYGGKSIVAAKTSSVHTDTVSGDYERLFASVQYRGFVMIEIRQTSSGYCMIEANPRMWGPSQFFVDAGANLFEAFLYDFGFLQNKPDFSEEQKDARYFWYGGVAEDVVAKQQLAYHGYTSDELCRELHVWLQSDVYNREDTRELFKQEVGL